MAKNIAILGSTGSIGTQALDVVGRLEELHVLGLSTNRNIDLLEEQIRKFSPKLVAVRDEEQAQILKKRISSLGTAVRSGNEGLCEVAAMEEADTLLTAVVGNAGLAPTFEGIRAGKNIALANKETLVCAGELFMKETARRGVQVYPVDSEHSAIFQCLQGSAGNKVNRILLTASGGPFRGKSFDELKNITVADALAHPTWKMGKKITIDSATLMNKGLEVIEAKWLFGVDVEQIEVLVHPQSIVHSAVEYEDGCVIAQMGEPDMRAAIQYAFTYPARRKSPSPALDLTARSPLTFEKPDMENFPCLKLAYRAVREGGALPAVMNGANEIAVELFLKGKLPFTGIPALVEAVMNAHTPIETCTLEALLAADAWAREYAEAHAPVE